MKKIINQLITVAIIATTVSHTAYCIPARKKNDAQASQLAHAIELKMEQAQNAQTTEEQQRLAGELAHEIEQATTYFDSMQNFFGYGSIAEKRRAHAEKQKNLLEHKLAQEEIRYKTLTSARAQEKSLKKQNQLKDKIHTEKIALGQAWSWQQKALLGALAVATAYVGYQYSGTIASTAKEWWSGKPQDSNQPTIKTPVETPPTISKQLWNKFEQLKEQGKKLQETTTKKINTLLTPTVDQQAADLARKAEQRLQWAAQQDRNLEQTKQDLIATARSRSEKQKQSLIKRELAAQQRKLVSEQTNIERLNRIDQKQTDDKINKYLKPLNLPPQQQKEYKKYLEQLDYNEIPSVATKQIPAQTRNNVSYKTEADTALPLRTITPEEQALQAQQYANYTKSLYKSMGWTEWLNSFFK